MMRKFGILDKSLMDAASAKVNESTQLRMSYNFHRRRWNLKIDIDKK